MYYFTSCMLLICYNILHHNEIFTCIYRLYIDLKIVCLKCASVAQCDADASAAPSFFNQKFNLRFRSINDESCRTLVQPIATCIFVPKSRYPWDSKPTKIMHICSSLR